jgi:hypothetical protein
MRQKKELKGLKFGFLSVLGPGLPQGTRNRPTWLVRCICSKEKSIREDVLVSNRVKSCGCASGRLKKSKMEKRYGLMNKKFGRLWVVWRIGSVQIGKSYHSLWMCKCVCGTFLTVQGGKLTSNKTTSCSACALED